MDQPLDIQMPILLTVEEAAQGCERQAIYFRRDRECTACSGGGMVHGRRCAPCEGIGFTFFPHRLSLTLPDGLENGQRIRVRGQGSAAVGSRAWGDLYFVCYVRPEQRRQGAGVPSEREATLQTLMEAKVTAKQAMRGGDAEAAIAALSAPPLAMLLDGEAHSLLGVAYANRGDKARAAPHLETALEKEPHNAVHHFNAGFLEAAGGNQIGACARYEAALHRSASYGQAREALQQALASLWRTVAPSLMTEPRLQVLHEVRQALFARHYLQAAGILGLINIAGLPAAVKNSLRLLLACAELLAYCAQERNDAEEVAALFDACTDFTPAPAALQQGILALERQVHCDGDLDGLLAFAKYQTTMRRYADAGATLLRAVRRAQAYAPSQERMAIVDPLVQAKQASILQRFEALHAALTASPRGHAEKAWLAGLTALAEAAYHVAVSKQIEPGWPFAVSAVQNLETAHLQAAQDVQKRDLFFQALEYENHLAAALLKQTDSEVHLLVQNTLEALRPGKIPHLPLRKYLRTPETRKELKELLTAAGKTLFKAAREPLRGEFVAEVREGQYILTNYRLLLMTDRLSQTHLLPLNTMRRYSPRVAGFATTTLVIEYKDGRQLALNRLVKGNYPPVDLIEYLLSAQMWDVLPPEDQLGLETGFASREAKGNPVRPTGSLPANVPASVAAGAVVAPPPAVPARPANATCRQCGRVSGSQDLFCRQCGASLGGESAPPSPSAGVPDSKAC